jgi:hypothetical protein
MRERWCSCAVLLGTELGTRRRAAIPTVSQDARPRNPVQYALWRSVSGNGEERMGGIKLIAALYTVFFVLMILIAIGSFFGVFDNPLIDPGM